MTELITPAKAAWIFSVGTGIASGLANYLAARYADEEEGLTPTQLLLGIILTLFFCILAIYVMKWFREEAGAEFKEGVRKLYEGLKPVR